MQFIIQNTNYLDQSYFKYKSLQLARRIILFYPMKNTELCLNKYLIAKYHTTLKTACLTILNNIKLSSSNSQNIIGIIKDKNLDNLAQLITYGNGTFLGSSILKDALS